MTNVQVVAIAKKLNHVQVQYPSETEEMEKENGVATYAAGGNLAPASVDTECRNDDGLRLNSPSLSVVHFKIAGRSVVVVPFDVMSKRCR
jgi:hypothetical protein